MSVDIALHSAVPDRLSDQKLRIHRSNLHVYSYSAGFQRHIDLQWRRGFDSWARFEDEQSNHLRSKTEPAKKVAPQPQPQPQ